MLPLSGLTSCAMRPPNFPWLATPRGTPAWWTTMLRRTLLASARTCSKESHLCLAHLLLFKIFDNSVHNQYILYSLAKIYYYCACTFLCIIESLIKSMWWVEWGWYLYEECSSMSISTYDVCNCTVCLATADRLAYISWLPTRTQKDCAHKLCCTTYKTCTYYTDKIIGPNNAAVTLEAS